MSDETTEKCCPAEQTEGCEPCAAAPESAAPDSAVPESAVPESAAPEGAPAKSYGVIESTARKAWDHVKGAATSIGEQAADLVQGRAWAPKVDLYTEGAEVVLVADLPGVDADAIQIVATPMLVKIGGEAPTGPVPSEGVVYTQRQRRGGAFFQEVDLPCAVYSDQVKAKVRKGVLEVRLPVMPETKVTPSKGEAASDS